jgi:hypothetical protein
MIADESAASVQQGHVTRYLATTTSTAIPYMYLIHLLPATSLCHSSSLSDTHQSLLRSHGSHHASSSRDRSPFPSPLNETDSRMRERPKLQLISQPTRGCSMSTLRALFRLLHPVQPSVHLQILQTAQPIHRKPEPSKHRSAPVRKGQSVGSCCMHPAGPPRASNALFRLAVLSIDSRSPSLLLLGSLCGIQAHDVIRYLPR